MSCAGGQSLSEVHTPHAITINRTMSSSRCAHTRVRTSFVTERGKKHDDVLCHPERIVIVLRFSKTKKTHSEYGTWKNCFHCREHTDSFRICVIVDCCGQQNVGGWLHSAHYVDELGVISRNETVQHVANMLPTRHNTKCEHRKRMSPAWHLQLMKLS